MNAGLQLNGQVEAVPKGIANLEGLIVHMMEKSESANEIVVDVVVDGERFSEEYAHQAGEIDLAGVGSIEIHTLTAEKFSKKFLKDAHVYIDYLKTGFLTSIQLLRNPGDEGAGFDILAKSFETMGALKSHLENVRDAVENLDVDPNAKDTLQRFDAMVDTLQKGMAGDIQPVVVADLLESEVIPYLNRWMETA